MARDHRKLRVFHEAHALTLAVYQHTRDFPRHEWYAVRLQMRKAAVSIPSNIVEGNARKHTAEYVHFLNIARASAAELTYLVDLARELAYLTASTFTDLNERCNRLCPQLQSLLQTMEALLVQEEAQRRGKRMPRK